MPNLTVESLMAEYTAKLTSLLQRQFVEQLEPARRALNSITSSASSTNGRRGSGSTKAPAGSSQRGGGRRSAEQIAALANKIVAYVKKNPGQRSEEISAGIGLSTKDMSHVIKQLLADKASGLQAQGKARGTRYRIAASKGRGAKPGRKKAAASSEAAAE